MFVPPQAVLAAELGCGGWLAPAVAWAERVVEGREASASLQPGAAAAAGDTMGRLVAEAQALHKAHASRTATGRRPRGKGSGGVLGICCAAPAS